ncbi:ubr3 ubiquitin ligase isoform X3 [Tachypleus tridentatus]|uniref:ubr3 ubiquitin ligase isoform X3 n=1 Tax=Tachypleus tridentatus TaxID=6853 RepID=UPI003FD40AC7
MADVDVTSLIKKGKRGAASYFQAECQRTNNPRSLHDLLDIIIDPSKPIDDWETIDWCRWLMAGGKTPDEYSQTVRRYDNATTCGLVWTANFVAYRCRTCGISPCMSLCADCFQHGDHEGHDFNMFRSQAGGACDCGDTSVMKESGFCNRHGPKAQLNKTLAPPDLLCVAEAMMPRIILRLIQYLREHSANSGDLSVISEADGFLSMLHHLSEMGGAMRMVMTRALTNPRTYSCSCLVEDCDQHYPERLGYLRRSQQLYEEAKKTLYNCDCPVEYQETIPSFHPDLKHSTFLEELVFWTVKFEFPQKLICFLLNMLPDHDYKEAFTQTFVHHYSRISVMLAHSSDSDTLSNRVVHVSVQLFSNEALAFRMTKNFKLLHVMVISLKAMMMKILIQNTLQDTEKNVHFVVNCGNRVMKDHCYWPVVSDLNNVLTHRPVALEFLKDQSLLEIWFSFLSMFQGMNVNHREVTAHVEFEPNTYYAAFSAELEASATAMWALISHLENYESLDTSKQVLSCCLSALEYWFDAIGFSLSDQAVPDQVSFHLPLHRYYSSFLCQAVSNQGATMTELLPRKELLQQLMFHPLQAIVAFHEILCGTWVRNGLQIKGQAMTYIQCHFCNSMVDADLFLLQVCATHLDPDWFLQTVLQRFHVFDWFSFHSFCKLTYLDADKVMPMLEGALNFLATLMTFHAKLGMNEEEVTRQEMISLLTMNDRTHSQLMDLLPEKCGTASQNKDFESILTKVADYRAPNFEAGGTMLQGMYVPKPEIWEQEYDPIHVLLRAVHRRDFQSSVDRYTQHVRQSGKYKSSSPPWLPYRIPKAVSPQFPDPRKLLHSRTMHAIIFTVLYRAWDDPDIPEQVVALSVYLLDMALRFPPLSCSAHEMVSPMKEEVPNLDFVHWFPTDWTLHNMVLTIQRVVVMEQAEIMEGVVEEMDVDEEVDGPSEGATYLVQSPTVEEEGFSSQSHHPSLPPSSVHLALPATVSTTDALVPLSGNLINQTSGSTSTVSVVAQHPHSYSDTDSVSPNIVLPPPLPPPLPPGALSSGGSSLAMVPSSVGLASIHPRIFKWRRFPGRNRVLSNKQSLQSVGSGESSSTRYHQESLKELPPSCNSVVDINESILSLLLRLHSKLSGVKDSYRPPTERMEILSDDAINESRIGDGPFFIGQVLDRFVQLNVSSGEQPVQDIRQRLWPKKEEVKKGGSAKDALDKEERKRRAKERQQKLMAEFASRQKAFMQQTMETELDSDLGDCGERMKEVIVNVVQEYECVICGQTAPSTEERPIGMVVLLQATSVLGHSRQDDPKCHRLPCSDEDRLTLGRDQTRAAYMGQRIDQLDHHFDNKSWQASVNIGWEGGVHVQSCGHYLHIVCHQSYTESLRQSQRHQNLAVEQGEYSCPLCRQLANSVLPIYPDMGETVAVVRCPPNNLSAVAQELSQLMATVPTPVSSIRKAMANIVEDLTNSTYAQFRSKYSSPNSHSLFLFICSIARTNLECELVYRGGTLSSIQPPKKSCFVPLFHVLALNAKMSTPLPYAQVWSQVTGLSIEDHFSSLAPMEREVPLFFRDTTAILLHVILTLPVNVDKAYYGCVVQGLYNLTFVRGLAQVSCYLTQEQRRRWKQKYAESQGCLNSLGSILGLVIDHLEHSPLYIDDEDMDVAMRFTDWSLQDIESHVTQLCLPYVQIASLLQHHLYNENLPEIQNSGQEFSSLCSYLGLFSSSPLSSVQCLNWATPEPLVLIRTWCQEYINFVNKAVISARNLLDQPLIWHQPALLQLPYEYSRIFQFYHQRACSVCHSVPKDPSLCLVCGSLVCLRGNCCQKQSLCEASSHSISCGAGTAMYLAVSSSLIIVIRGKRACLWGSVYLDSYGEEDRDLKRGKPLFLSQERYNLLQKQWLGHRFDHTNKRWVWHKDNL